jgi:hypothetical protein
MSEDYEFFANCGQKFEDKSNLTEGDKRFYYTSDGKKIGRSYGNKNKSSNLCTIEGICIMLLGSGDNRIQDIERYKTCYEC